MPSIALQHLDYGEMREGFREVGYVLSQNSTQQYLVRPVLSFCAYVSIIYAQVQQWKASRWYWNGKKAGKSQL